MSNLSVDARLKSLNSRTAVLSFKLPDPLGQQGPTKHTVRVRRGSAVFAKLHELSLKPKSNLRIEVFVNLPKGCSEPVYTVVGI